MKLKESIDNMPLFYDDNLELPKEPEIDMQQIAAKLDEIIERLDRIESKLGGNFPGNSNNKSPMTESLQPSAYPGLYPPANVVPKGAMLGEIQSVLASQLAAEKSGEPMGDVVTDVCSLPSSMYDDNI